MKGKSQHSHAPTDGKHTKKAVGDMAAVKKASGGKVSTGGGVGK